MTKTVTQQQTSICAGIDQAALAVADDIVRQMMDRGALLAVRDNDGELVPMDLGRQFQLKAAWQTVIAAALIRAHSVAVSAVTPYQARVSAAHHALFHDDPTDIAERCARFFEEAAETAQAFGMTGDEARQLIDYTFGRPSGEPAKEIGAAALTLASLCVTAGYDMMACAEADLEKLQRPETIARIRAKRATRHGRGPLPGLDPAPATKGTEP